MRRLPNFVVCVLLAGAVAPAVCEGFERGFTDPYTFQADEALRRPGLDNARRARAGVVRVVVQWSTVSPSRPPSRTLARDPSWGGFYWDSTDRAVRDIASAGLRPLLTLTTAPRWAEGAGRPPVSDRAPAGTWRPSVAAFRDFSRAIVRRYSGRYSGSDGANLPRVRLWQPWNEPNLSHFLSPQWTRSGGRQEPASPRYYRKLLNAFYPVAKAESGSNFVLSAGTAPFGDPSPGGRRMPPALFTRELLCVRGRTRPKPVRCPGGPARLDGLAHHPYPIGPPTRRAANPDDVSLPDMAKLRRPLAVALRSGRVLPRRPKQLWATEFSWDSSPPDPLGTPALRHGRYLEGAFYVLWRQGVDAAIWWQIRDAPEDRGYAYSLQSGVFYRSPGSPADDVAKPAFTAFRFPFTAYRRHGRARLWGIAPSDRRVTVEVRRGKRWHRLVRLRPGRTRVFHAARRISRGSLLRARSGNERSLTWPVR